MANAPSTTNPSQILCLENQPISTKRVELLDPRRTLYRVELEPDSFRSSIPSELTEVIIKQQKVGWETCFQDEREAYEKLKTLQGVLIPKLYGQGTFDGRPALVLSVEAGCTLYELALNLNHDINYDTLEMLLEEVFSTFAQHGAVYWDQRADNFLFWNGKVTALDLEEVRFPGRFGECDILVNQGGASILLDEMKAIRNSLSRRLDYSQFAVEGKLFPESRGIDLSVKQRGGF